MMNKEASGKQIWDGATEGQTCAKTQKWQKEEDLFKKTKGGLSG